jgi:putative Ca2+/H+ antiporter (TMEM165/GDT1 family)
MFSLTSRKPGISMQAILDSTLVVALAEMGDKTQLLSLMLVLRYKKPWAIMGGIFVATVLNHLMATWLGTLIAGYIPQSYLQYGLALLFILFGLWILKPDKSDDLRADKKAHSAFMASVAAFFIGEMGDKTQLVTVALAARYQSIWLVSLGSTIGMMLANSLSVFGGEKLIKVIPMNYVRCGASVVFVLFGLAMLPI